MSFVFLHPWFAYCKITMYIHVCEESPLLCGFTAMLFGLMLLVYEDSVKVTMV